MLKQIILTLGLMSPVSVAAETNKISCMFTGSGGSQKYPSTDFISTHSLFEIDATNRAATAHDAFIEYLYEGPIPVKFKLQSDGKYRLRWKLRSVPVEVSRRYDDSVFPYQYESKLTIRYSLLFDPATFQGTMVVRGGGKTLNSAGLLDCQTTKQDLIFTKNQLSK